MTLEIKVPSISQRLKSNIKTFFLRHSFKSLISHCIRNIPVAFPTQLQTYFCLPSLSCVCKTLSNNHLLSSHFKQPYVVLRCHLWKLFVRTHLKLPDCVLLISIQLDMIDLLWAASHFVLQVNSSNVSEKTTLVVSKVMLIYHKHINAVEMVDGKQKHIFLDDKQASQHQLKLGNFGLSERQSFVSLI